MGLENLCEVHQSLQHNDFIFVLEFYSWERDWEVSALTGGLKIGNGNGDWKRLTLSLGVIAKKNLGGKKQKRVF